MTWPTADKHLPVELSPDQRFTARVARLVVVSAVALGVIWVLATATEGASGWILAALFVGWLAMPALLAVSLIKPMARFLLMIPATLVSFSLIGICATALPVAGADRIGWPMITAGVLLGVVLGGWFWFRWVPVPSAFDAPFSPARWLLVAVHVGLIVVGSALVIVGLVS
jgi:hypothetical protein